MTSTRTADSSPWLRRHYPKLLVTLIAAAALAGGAYVVNRKTPEGHLASARTLQQRGDIKAAIIEIKTALQATPQSPEVRFQLAQAEFAGNDFAAAEKELRKVRELGLQRDELTLLLARTLIELNKPELVLDEIQPRKGAPAEVNVSLLALRAMAQFMTKDSTAMQATLAEADKLLPDHPDTLWVRAQFAQTQGNFTEALGLVDKGLAKSPSHPELWVSKGNYLLALKQVAPAQAAFAKALALAPGNIPARTAIIQSNIDAGALDKAEAELNILGKYSPNNVVSLFLGAQIEFARKHYSEALAKSQTLLTALPDFLPARLLAAKACLTLGKPDEAQTHLKRVLEAQPKHPGGRRLMVWALLQQGQFGPAKALVDLLGKEEGDDAFLTTLRGKIALRQKDYVTARHEFQKAADSSAGTPSLFVELAASQRGSGDFEAAIKSQEKASELDKTSFQADIQLVSMLLKRQRFDEAFKAVDRLAAKKPKPALLENMRGVIYAAKKDNTQARASFEKALKTDPQYLPAVRNLANLDFMAKDFKAAAGRYEAALKLAPNNLQILLDLANISARVNDGEGYRGYLENAKKADGKNVEARRRLVIYWLNKNNPVPALAEAREALTTTGEKAFYEWIGLALSMYGDTQSALETYKRWVQESPKSALACVRLAEAQANAGKPVEAMKSLNQALVLQPEFPAARALKMALLTQGGDYRAALQIARELQAKQPKQPIGYFGEANVLAKQKQFVEAGGLYTKLAHMTGQGLYLEQATKAYQAAGKDGEAVKLLEQWLHDHPDDRGGRYTLALALEKMQRKQDAIEQYRLLVKSNPKDWVAYNNLALLLHDMKDPGAVAAAEQAYKISPDNPSVQDTLGWVLIQNGQGKRGISLIKQAFDKVPDSYEYQWHYAKGLIAIGEPVLARQELDRLLTRGKTFPQAEEARKLMDSLKR